MKRCACVALIVLVVSAVCHSAPVEAERKIEPFNRGVLLQAFERNQKVRVLAIGEGRIGYAGLYVYDGQGNCIKWDDASGGDVQDDLGVEFVAAEAGPYMIEVRNMAQLANNFHFTIK